MMKYKIKTAREEENAVTQQVRDGVGHGRRRRSSSLLGGWWGSWDRRIATRDWYRYIVRGVCLPWNCHSRARALCRAVRRWQRCHERIHSHEKKKKQAIPWHHPQCTPLSRHLCHRQITRSFRGYQKAREREREWERLAAYLIINRHLQYTYQTHQHFLHFNSFSFLFNQPTILCIPNTTFPFL